MPGFQDLINWCTATSRPPNRATVVSVNLFETPAAGAPESCAWIGTLSPAMKTPTFGSAFLDLQGSLEPLPSYAARGPVTLHIEVSATTFKATATLTGGGVQSHWHDTNPGPVFLFNETNYHGYAVISGTIDWPPPSPPLGVGTTLYPIVLSPSYTYFVVQPIGGPLP